MSPFELGGEMIRKVTIEKTTWNEFRTSSRPEHPRSHEAVGLGAAIDYLTETGLEAIERHEAELTAYAWGGCRRSRVSTLYGPPPDRRAGIVSFNLEGSTPTMSPRSWTPRASPSARATTATSR